MHPEIEKLIEMALADEQVTEKEREIILRKAEKLDLDLDEVEMYLEGKINENETISTTKKEISNLNYKSSINKEESQSRIYTLKKVNHLKPETLDKESELKLIIDDINKNNSNLLNKLNHLFSKIKEPHDFLLNKKTKVDNQIEIIKAEYNNLSKIHLDRFFNEINKQVSNKFGLTKLIINSPEKIIGLNSNEVIELIKNKGTWDNSILNQEYVKKRRISKAIVWLGIFSTILIGNTKYNDLLEIGIERNWGMGITILLSTIAGLVASNYSKLIESNKMNFSIEDIIFMINETVVKFENNFNELIILKNQLSAIELISSKLELINISECENILKQNK